MLELTVAIPFYDRLDLLRHCLRTLNCQRLADKTRFVAYGDGGFDRRAIPVFLEYLPKCKVIAWPEHVGAGGLTRGIVDEFARDPHSHRLLICDSDMIARSDLIAKISGWPIRDDMLVSVYNSSLHAPLYVSKAPFLHKRVVGSTGTLWTSLLARLVVDNVPAGDHFDDKFCAFLQVQGMPICCYNESLIQHLGFSGQHNRLFGTIDYGLNFVPNGHEQAEAMADMLDYVMTNQGFFCGNPRSR